MQLEWFTNEIEKINLNEILRYFIYDPSDPLMFTGGLFFILFTVFFLIYIAIHSRKSIRNIWVISFSMYFYYKSSGNAVIILAGSIIANYFLALLIYELFSKRLKKTAFIFTLILNVSLLAYYKYVNFFIDNVNYFSGTSVSGFDIIFPIGISFFTFQTLSYHIDVYRETIKPTYKLLDYAFYISFFPYIVAGPIVRAGDLLPQNSDNLRIKNSCINYGLYLIIRGLIKKAILSFYLAQYGDIIYGMPGSYSGFENLVAMYSYTFQIYLDFSGYSDIAIGLAGIMGFKLKDNFKRPYISLSINEFWNRWHISLSTWLRDYLFLPLSYSRIERKKAILQRENIPSWKWTVQANSGSETIKLPLITTYIYASMITMFIAGVWHGAAWKYIIWGTLHGLGLSINKLFNYYITKKVFRKKLKLVKKIKLTKYSGWLLTFHFIAFLWILFRADTLNDAAISTVNIFTNFDINYFLPFIKARMLLSIIFAVSVIFIFMPRKVNQTAEKIFAKTPFIIKALLLIIIIQIIIQIQTESVQPFIYFKF